MSGVDFNAGRKSVKTAAGTVSYVERGSGPVALFVHGVLLNGYFWRHQLAGLSDARRCIAPDLLAHGHTEVAAGQDVSVTAQAHMLAQFLDAIEVKQVDLVGNDSGGGVCQIFATNYPQRVRSLTLTNCDAHDNWPPEAFKPFVEMVGFGGLPVTLNAMVQDKSVFRSPGALGPAYEDAAQVTDDTIDTYLQPFTTCPTQMAALERFVNAFDNRHTVAIEAALKELRVPTLIAWGTDDVYFPLQWSHWLEKAIPGTTRREEFKDARIFFPEERPAQFNRVLRAHWLDSGKRAATKA